MTDKASLVYLSDEILEVILIVKIGFFGTIEMKREQTKRLPLQMKKFIQLLQHNKQLFIWNNYLEIVKLKQS